MWLASYRYDPRLGPNRRTGLRGREDMLLALRLLQDGFALRYCPGAVVEHPQQLEEVRALDFRIANTRGEMRELVLVGAWCGWAGAVSSPASRVSRGARSARRADQSLLADRRDERAAAVEELAVPECAAVVRDLAPGVRQPPVVPARRAMDEHDLIEAREVASSAGWGHPAGSGRALRRNGYSSPPVVWSDQRG